ncbi:Uu.00g021560.m01.CDS01 [Anthostomella pinea]|uniref:Uu.00g021560.m01.CDS01 n=1 Tax=Anthostomella pinea TaxID=933095 RepID=A0AAI8VZP5_9PEZI|nr:Uu.00g021560.m01.CDS01 [Anthostomella pinea]
MSSIKDYGVWKGTPTSYTAQTLQQDKTPHVTLKFSDGSGTTREAEINVASTSDDKDLVYWLHRTWNHPITKSLTALPEGFHQVTKTDGAGTNLSLDYIRTKPALLDLSQGRVLPNNEAGANNDILDQLKPILDDAIAAKAVVYCFGSSYETGIHDIHMNQGNDASFGNAVGSDGAVIFHYSGDATTAAHFEAVFLAFADQKVPTNDQTGAPDSGAQPLAQVAKGTASTTTSS